MGILKSTRNKKLKFQNTMIINSVQLFSSANPARQDRKGFSISSCKDYNCISFLMPGVSA